MAIYYTPQMERLRDSYIQNKDGVDPSCAKETSSPVSILDITTMKGKEKFKEAIDSSRGTAAVIVHPFWHDKSNYYEPKEEQNRYRKYKRRLKTSIGEYKKIDLPLILFEEAYRISNWQSILNRMGVQEGNIFVLPTWAGSPAPADEKHDCIYQQLKANGLRRVTVGGSYLRLYDPNRFPWQKAREWGPPIAKNYDLGGCVGTVITNFLDERIIATPAFATYPGRKDPLLY